MNLKTDYVRFHAELYSPGVIGVLGTVLPSTNKAIEGLDMTLNEAGLVVTGRFQGQDVDLFIPHGNIVMARLSKSPAAKIQPIKKVS